ncbi:glycosyltransferase family 2 protein [Patescibacteria group bacterium]|nr:glycosyltransferase family 2 protein [Patescibacteria group bacterium]MBU1877118.1 glycosyltransferase family 2 protein [Patescibacteria group bacterium]
MKLSVIIPAYKEETRIINTLREIDKYLTQQNYSYEILVVDDGSPDKTVEVVQSLTTNIKNLKVIGYKKNQGKGYAVRLGMIEAKGKYCLFTDADNSTSIDQVEKMWPQFEAGFDVVIGSRDVEGAISDPPQPWIRDVITAGTFKLLRKITVGLWNIEDSQCGFKCIKKTVVEKILPLCKINRFAFDPEMLVLTERAGYKIKEIPVYWKNDLDSKVKFSSMVKMGIDLLIIRLNLIKGDYNVKF